MGPRPIRLTGGGYALVVVAALLVLGGIAAGVLLAVSADRRETRQALLRREGRGIEAQVTRVWKTSDKEHHPMAAYGFEVDGRKYSHSVRVPGRIWKGLATGSRLAVVYLPSDPALSHPRDWAQDRTPVWAPFLVGCLFSGIGVGMLFLLSRQMGLLSEGRPAPAVVTKYSPGQHGQKNVHYEFPLLSGALVKGKSGPRRRLPEIGATICVIYHPDNPRRNATYPLDLVGVDPNR